MSLNRRKFLYYASISGLSLATAACNPNNKIAGQSVAPSQKSKKKLGVALVGLGGYSSGVLAPALQMTQHCYLAGIVTGTPDKIPTWQQRYNIKR